LPTEDEIAAGLPQNGEGERNAEDVALSFGEEASVEAAAKLEEWGWSQNVQRTFEIDATTADPASVTFINVSIHRFADEASAGEALTYFSEAAASGGLTDTESDQIGDQSRALVGGETGSNQVAIYVQRGVFLIRVGTFSPQGDALPTAIEVAQLVVDKS